MLCIILFYKFFFNLDDDILNIFFIFCFLGLLYFSQLETWYFAKNLFAFHRHVYISQKGCVPWFYHFSKVK